MTGGRSVGEGACSRERTFAFTRRGRCGHSTASYCAQWCRCDSYTRHSQRSRTVKRNNIIIIMIITRLCEPFATNSPESRPGGIYLHHPAVIQSKCPLMNFLYNALRRRHCVDVHCNIKRRHTSYEAHETPPVDPRKNVFCGTFSGNIPLPPPHTYVAQWPKFPRRKGTRLISYNYYSKGVAPTTFRQHDIF